MSRRHAEAGKGSRRRPAAVSEAELAENWAVAFPILCPRKSRRIDCDDPCKFGIYDGNCSEREAE